MSRLNFDTLTLVYHELYSNQSLSDLRSAASVCRSWRSAATPFLFRNIQVDFSSERETQLEKWTSSPLSQDSPSRCFVRQLQVRGSQRSLLDRYLDNIVNSLPSLPNLSHFSWCFRGNIPRRLVHALNDHCSLQSLHLWLYIHPKEEVDLVNIVDSGRRNLSLVIEGKRLRTNELDPAWPPAKYGPDILLDAGFLMDHRDERMASLAPKEFVSTRPPKRPNPGLESLVLRGIDIRTWQKGNPSHALKLHNLKILAVVNCNNPMLISWTRYPQDLESLEIVNPDQTYPYKAGLVVTDSLLAKPLSHFCHLSEINLQHIGSPICEVLFQLGLEAGKQLKVLKLHDQEVTGVDEIYSFQRDGSDALDCPMYKLLVYICPNLEVLSLDISSNAVDSKSMGRHYRSSDSRSVALEPLLEEVNNVSSLPVFETLRSLQCLRSLRLVTADVGNARSEHVSDRIGKSICSADIEYFTLAVSASRSTEDIGNVEDVFRLDPNGASHLIRRPDIWHTVPRAIWYG